jgi:hypothetical protein
MGGAAAPTPRAAPQHAVKPGIDSLQKNISDKKLGFARAPCVFTSAGRNGFLMDSQTGDFACGRK